MARTFNVSEADFLRIRTNFKNFLATQDEFTDHNFEGSGLSILIDAVSYGIHYHATHSNLVFSETFLDTANLRRSVVSRAKELGYLPRSKSAAVANITVSFSVSGNPNEYVLPRGTRFSSNSTTESSYSFTTLEDIIVENDGNNVFSKSIAIYQGKLNSYSYTVNLNNSGQRLIIPSKDVDVDHLSVYVKNSVSDTVTETYTYFDEIPLGSIDGETNVYFLRETFDGYYEVYFGDDVLGRAIQTGNVVELHYLITSGEDANDRQLFTLSSSLSGVSSVSITTVDASYGGDERESVSSIKFLAPMFYQSQNRAVTKEDYKAIIMRNYPNIIDVSVWGGEDNVPPYYGKVFAAVKPKNQTFLSNTVKQTIQNDLLRRFGVAGIRPELVDADYIDVSVNTTVTYNARLYGNISNVDLENSVRDTIETFFDDEANKFGSPLYYSKLVAAIDDTSDLIINSVTNLTLEKSVEIYQGVSGTYTFEFNNAIHPGSFITNEFLIDGVAWRIRDIPIPSGFIHTTGRLAIYRETSPGSYTYLSGNTGTINYTTGEITISNIIIDSVVDDPIFKKLVVSVSPGAVQDPENPQISFTDYNVYTNERNQIIRLKENGVSLTLIPDEN